MNSQYLEALQNSDIQVKYKDLLTAKICKMLSDFSEEELWNELADYLPYSFSALDEHISFQNLPDHEHIYQAVKVYLGEVIAKYRSSHLFGGYFHKHREPRHRDISSGSRAPAASGGPYDESVYHQLIARIIECIIDVAESAIPRSFASKLKEIMNNRNINASQASQMVERLVGVEKGNYSSKYCYYMNGEEHPDVNFVILICLCFELSVEEATQLLNLAGYNWSDSAADRIILKHLNTGNFNLAEINEQLADAGENALSRKRAYV